MAKSLKQLSYSAIPSETKRSIAESVRRGDGYMESIRELLAQERNISFKKWKSSFNELNKFLKVAKNVRIILNTMMFVISQDSYYQNFLPSPNTLYDYKCKNNLIRCWDGANWFTFLHYIDPDIREVFEEIRRQNTVADYVDFGDNYLREALPKHLWALYFTHKISYTLYWNGNNLSTRLNIPGYLFLPSFLIEQHQYKPTFIKIIHSDTSLNMKMISIYNFLMRKITKEEMINDYE